MGHSSVEWTSVATGYRWQMSGLPVELEELLEKNLGADPVAFLDPRGFRTAMIRAERCVAQIENPEGTAQGTGFLVAGDLLITNDHVRSGPADGRRPFDVNPGAVRVRFGHVEGARVSSRCYALHATDWLVDRSPQSELDYCLLRLAEPAGQHAIGDDRRAPLRGWISPAEHEPVNGQSLFILQHPQGEPLRFAPGHLWSTSSDWLKYRVNTDHGSSGSPVFDSTWRCVALHSRAGRQDNAGAVFKAILATMPAHVREELAPAPPEADGDDTEGLAQATRGTAIDLSGLSVPATQSIGNTLLARAAAAPVGGRVGPFDVNLGGGRKLLCTPSELATDPAHRQALQGDLGLLQTRLLVLQQHQSNYQVDLNSIVAWPILIQRTTNGIGEVTILIKERLDLMIESVVLIRS